jgi:hypothetical protein
LLPVTEEKQPNDELDRLVGWKAIAGHLKVSPRTAVRWAETYELPVSRVPRGNRPLVFAAVQELDAWWGSAAARQARGEEAAVQDAAPELPSSKGTDLIEEVATREDSGVGVSSEVTRFSASRKVLLVGGLLACLVVVVGASVVYWPAQPSRQAERTLPWRSTNGAHGAATSRQVVEFRVAPAGHPWFSVTVAEGEMARLETATRRVAFQPRLTAGQLKVFVYRLDSRGSGESAAYVASRTLSNGKRVEPVDVGGELVDLLWLGDLPAAGAEGHQRREPCCMVCTAVTACGQTVSAPCGRCEGNEESPRSKNE